jgi:ArsR family transcriptional regulator, arsenate/arsenite/antimonite-responsive transcriptional repressor
VPITRKKADDLAPLARLLEGLADERRLRMVSLLSHGELCVCHIEAALELPQAEVSRQLGFLRAAGVVTARRQHPWVYYRLAEPEEALCRAQLDLLASQFGQRAQLRKDVERLLKTRGPNSCK